MEIADEIVKGRCRPFLKEIPRSGANSRVTEVTIGAKGMDEIRERLVIRTIPGAYKWKTAERAFHIMEVISGHGFTCGPFRVPLPIDQDPESRTLIEQGMRGKSLYDKLLTASREDARLYVRMTAQWLASLYKVMGGKEKAEKFIHDLAATKPLLVESLTPAGARITTGETPIGIAFLKNVVFYGKKGVPLDYVRLGKFMGDGQAVALGTKAPNESLNAT